jgi:hypothetical protein
LATRVGRANWIRSGPGWALADWIAMRRLPQPESVFVVTV